MVSWHRNIRRTWNGASSSLWVSTQGINRSRPLDRRRSTAPVALTAVRLFLWLGLAAVVLWMSTVAWWSHSILKKGVVSNAQPPININRQESEDQDINTATDESSLLTSIDIGDLWPDDFASNNIFETLKGCDPNKEDEEQGRKCLQQQPITNGSRQRIGLLYPPGALSYMFTQFIKDVVRLHALPDTDLELIPTTHINIDQHNFTKVIRLAILPVILSATDTVLSTVDASFPMASVTIDDLVTSARQLLRWHCHLSRVAESTPLITMTLADLVENPWEAELNVRSFLSLEPHDPNNYNNNEWSEKHVDEDEMMASLEEMLKYCTSLLENLEKATTKKVQPLLKAVVEDELKANAVTCQAVRELQGQGSVATRTLGAFLSPDSSLSNDICNERPSAPICKDREAPISSRALVTKSS